MIVSNVKPLATAVALLWALSACDQEPAPAAAGGSAAPVASTAATGPTARAPAAASAATAPKLPPLLDPKSATLQAPARFKVKFATTKGDFVVEVVREWAPRGADRFFNLVKIGFYQDMAVYRVVKGFVVQFGLHGDPKVSAVWRGATIMDEMVSESNKRGYLTYAKSGADSRTTQLFISLHDNPDLDRAGFSPFAKVVAGMEVVDRFYAGYAEKPSAAGGQKRILAEGNAYLKKSFPRLDYIKSASIVE